MRKKFWYLIHNAIAHPLLVTGTEWANKFHDWTADKMELKGEWIVFGFEHPIPNEGDIEVKFDNGEERSYDESNWPNACVTHWRRKNT